MGKRVCANPSMGKILEIENLSLAFGGVHALVEVSLAVEEGSITAVIGPNGAGKTSLFNSISGFYKPQAGRIVFEGTDITRHKPPRRAALGLARTFQNIALFQGMTVLDNIKARRDGAARRDRARHHRFS
jgi:branched-chain amino acid transport system ATP-binding protein